MSLKNYYFSIHGCEVEGYCLVIYKKKPNTHYPHLDDLTSHLGPKEFKTFPEIIDELEKFEVGLNEEAGIQRENVEVEK